MYTLVISDPLEVAVRDNKVVNLKVSILSEIDSSVGRDLMNFRAVSTSHIKVYFGKGGLLLNSPDNNCEFVSLNYICIEKFGQYSTTHCILP